MLAGRGEARRGEERRGEERRGKEERRGRKDAVGEGMNQACGRKPAEEMVT